MAMNIRTILLAGLLAMPLASCGTAPMNATEFRNDYAARAQPEVFVVSRALDDVAGTIRRKASECLDVVIETTSWVGTSGTRYTRAFRPTVLAGADRVELHVQQLIDGTGIVIPYEAPDGGFYILVADFFPVTAATTRVEMYPPTRGYEVLADAIRGWASRPTSGCPDLSAV